MKQSELLREFSLLLRETLAVARRIKLPETPAFERAKQTISIVRLAGQGDRGLNMAINLLINYEEMPDGVDCRSGEKDEGQPP